MPAMSGQNWRNSPPATAPHTDVMPPNTEPTRKRMEFLGGHMKTGQS